MQRRDQPAPDAVREIIRDHRRRDHGKTDLHVVGIDDQGITVIIVTSDDDLNRINPVGRRSIGEREGVPYGAAANVCAPADVGGTDLEINPRAETGHVVRFHAFGHVDLERVGDASGQKDILTEPVAAAAGDGSKCR